MNKLLCLCTGLLMCGVVIAQPNNKVATAAVHNNPGEAYLFVYFTGNDKSEEQIRFALSGDGYHFKALNGNKPVIPSAAISSTGGVRDPHILRGADGKTFYMVATDMVSANGWSSNRAMVLLKSTDLIHWTSAVVNIQQRFAGNDSLLRVWAPQTIYDEAASKYLIYFSMKHGHEPDKIYYAYANSNFTDLETEPKQLFYSPTNGACIDGDIVHKDGRFYLIFKTEGGQKNGLKVAVSDQLTSGYTLRDEYVQQTTDPVEGGGVFRLNGSNDYILMYDVYTKGKYQFTRTSDLEHFKVVDEEVTMDFHPRHGTVMPITGAEAIRLSATWGQQPVKNSYTHNPVLNGLYADPDILYSQKTKKYYIYPTSDGFTGWSGTYFKTFSSPDLVHWKDEGVILDLPKDVKWASKNAWAPTITEKKINGQYKYFYYFTAAQKIGVAVSDNPTGPFVDAGKPLIDQRPEGVKGGQQIDPDVFTDPATGKSYLYWGNGYMVGVELNADMVSVKPETMKVLTPDRTFREGTHVLYRKGVYYFMWSENDTRDADYRVRYGTATSPLGAITIPANNLVIAKDSTQGIYATGHNSTIQVPGTDEWYIVYHRFNYPNGITMGKAAGYNREVCLDKLEFNSDGSIRLVKPTHKGITPHNYTAKQQAGEVLDMIYTVNRYWQAQHPEPGWAFWDNAAYQTGNMEAYFLTKDSAFKQYSANWADVNQWMGATSTDKATWKYNYGEKDAYVLFGDWQTCFQTYIDLYRLDPEEKKIARAKEVMEYEMSTARHDYWWWADGLYMVMPVMTKLYNVTHNKLYLEKLHEYFQFADSLMYDDSAGLYYRDANYVYPKHTTASGKRDFWARGDGWVFAALAKVIKDLPANAPHRSLYVSRFKRMARSIKAAQQPEGYWTRSLLDPAFAPGPETSGTAFFTYGLFWGINNGLLNKNDYLPAAQAGWNYLSTTALQPDGSIGYVQPIGARAIPGQVVNQHSTANFGVGAFLLAACELHRWLSKK